MTDVRLFQHLGDIYDILKCNSFFRGPSARQWRQNPAGTIHHEWLPQGGAGLKARIYHCWLDGGGGSRTTKNNVIITDWNIVIYFISVFICYLNVQILKCSRIRMQNVGRVFREKTDSKQAFHTLIVSSMHNLRGGERRIIFVCCKKSLLIHRTIPLYYISPYMGPEGKNEKKWHVRYNYSINTFIFAFPAVT